VDKRKLAKVSDPPRETLLPIPDELIAMVVEKVLDNGEDAQCSAHPARSHPQGARALSS
jgi:hypothetical protein